MVHDIDLPVAEFAFPGPLRDQLVEAILLGAKTSSTSTVLEYSIENQPLPQVGRREQVIDSNAVPVAIIETVSVRMVRLADVDLAHARDEGEGYETVSAWRAAHESFWHGTEMREFLGDPDFTTDDDTPVVLERFRVIRRLSPSTP